MKPNLFIVGAPKCGTTAWVEYLRSHPDIFFARMKEPHFFATDLPGRRAVRDLEDYEALFADSGDAPIRGEASVLYLFSPEAAQAIHGYNPDARILIFLRNQEEMLPALHQQFLYSFNEEIADFATAWRLSEKRPPDTVPGTCLESSLLDYAALGRFDEQVERYLRLFPRAQVHVVHFDEWTSNPRRTYLQIIDFLGLPDDGRSEFPRVNEAKHYRNRWVGKFLRNPPAWLGSVLAWVKALVGKRSLGVGRHLRDLNLSPGYANMVPDDVKDEIRRFFAPHQRRLAAMLGEIGEGA